MVGLRGPRETGSRKTVVVPNVMPEGISLTLGESSGRVEKDLPIGSQKRGVRCVLRVLPVDDDAGRLASFIHKESQKKGLLALTTRKAFVFGRHLLYETKLYTLCSAHPAAKVVVEKFRRGA